MVNAVCVFHNGNSRVIDDYKKKYSELQFAGNWACNEYNTGSLYEISNADATKENLFDMRSRGVKIIRHVSTREDDLLYRVEELDPGVFDDWHKSLVITNLCFADSIITEFTDSIDSEVQETTIITTGRTASTHFEEHLFNKGIQSYEGGKVVDTRLRKSQDSILLWRKDIWEVLTSIIISESNGFQHSNQGTTDPVYNKITSIDFDWIKYNFWNMCQNVLDNSLYYKFIIKKPIVATTTEDVIKYQTTSKKISYQKNNLISNFDRAHKYFDEINFENKMNILYNNTLQLLGEQYE